MPIEECCGDSCPEFKKAIEDIVKEYPNVFDNANAPLEILFRKIWNTSLRLSSDYCDNHEGPHFGPFEQFMA
jgi:hypothetical protein